MELSIFQETETPPPPPFSPPHAQNIYIYIYIYFFIFYIFSKESFSYLSRNENHEETSYISGIGKPEKIPYISGSNFPNSKNKNISPPPPHPPHPSHKKRSLYFGKWNFLVLILKKILTFSYISGHRNYKKKISRKNL